jgi:glycosyltransferase involved in cell wall biosynthesis
VVEHSPLVSVAMITFNHERYIADAIRSVLRQTVDDLEVVLVDDGSRDDTCRVASQFDDGRLRLIRQENAGPGAALNRAIADCRGRHIAIMSGDDVCALNRLAVQLRALAAAAGGVVFSNMDYIDERGEPVTSAWMRPDQYLCAPMSRAQILARFFDSGNFVAAPTCFATAETMRQIGPFDPCLYQTQDFDWTIRAAKQCDLTFLPDKTVRYRILTNNGNLSAPHPRKGLRTRNEYYLVLRRFFDDLPPDLFREAFRERLLFAESRSPAELACEQAFLYLAHPLCPTARLIGIEKLHDLLLDPAKASILRTRFGYTPSRLAQDLLALDPTNELAPYRTKLYAHTGQGYDESHCCVVVGDHRAEAFELTYNASALSAVGGLCWKPAELLLCSVQLDDVTWRDGAGRKHTLDLTSAVSNGSLGSDGFVRFGHLDPKFFLPISGDIRTVTVRGRWRVMDAMGSVWQANTLLIEAEERARVLQDRLEALERATEGWRGFRRAGKSIAKAALRVLGSGVTSTTVASDELTARRGDARRVI